MNKTAFLTVPMSILIISVLQINLLKPDGRKEAFSMKVFLEVCNMYDDDFQ